MTHLNREKEKDTERERERERGKKFNIKYKSLSQT